MIRAMRLTIPVILIAGCHEDGGECPTGGVAPSVEATPIAGSRDKTFATDGVLNLNFSDWRDRATAIAVDAEAIYLAGTVQIQKTPKLPEGLPQLWNGHLEKRRRSDGAEMWSPGIRTKHTFIAGLALAQDALYLVGERRPGGSTATTGWIEKRSLVDGSLIWERSALRSIAGVAIDSTALYVAGVDALVQGHFRWRLEKRSLTTGGVIFSVADDSTLSPYAHGPTAVVRDSQALYILGSQSISKGNSQWRIEKRSLWTGGLIPGFGENGVLMSKSGLGHAAALDESALYVVGGDRLEKRDPGTGKLVETFGNGGVIRMDLSATAVLPDSGAIYVAGSQGNQFRVERRSAQDGGRVAAFGSALDPKSAGVAALAIHADRLYLAGSDNIPESNLKKMVDVDWQWRVEARLK